LTLRNRTILAKGLQTFPSFEGRPEYSGFAGGKAVSATLEKPMSAVANLDGAIGRSAMSKAFRRILPLILAAYLFAYMDRVNVSFAATQMNEDLKFSATIYGLGGGLFFLGYALFEIPSNLMLVRFGARKWIARIMITWGLLSAAMMLVSTPMQFYVLRFLLGVAEAGFYPGVIYYFSGWFPPCHRSRVVSRFYVATPLASAAMGAMSGWLLGLDGHSALHGWQWLFLVQGLPTVLVGLAVLRYLPDSPSGAAWLSQAEKDWIHRELALEQARIGSPARHNVLAIFRNPRVLMFGAIGILLIGAIITFILSAPTILAGATGLDQTRVGYLVSLGGVMGAAAILFGGNYADRNGDRFLNAFWCSIVMAGAFLAIAIAPSPIVVGIAYLAFATVCFVIPMLSSSAWAEVLSVRELAVGGAAINTISQIGAFVTPFAWGAARDATGSFDAGLTALFFMTLTMAGLLLLLRGQVRGSAMRRVAIPA
jgi:ACS family tartrate transporter-like MFS transporter